MKNIVKHLCYLLTILCFISTSNVYANEEDSLSTPKVGDIFIEENGSKAKVISVENAFTYTVEILSGEIQLFGKTCSVHLLVNYGKPKTAIRNIGSYTYCYETARVQQKKCTKCGKTNFYERTVLNKYKHTYKNGSKTCSRCGYVNKIS